VAGLMTSPAVTIGRDAPLGTAARLMRAHRIRRLPVVDADGSLTGIVSRADLLSVFVRPDAEIAAEASAVQSKILLADPAAIRVTVDDGVVPLAGRLTSREQIGAAIRLTEAIDGVVAVRSNLNASGELAGSRLSHASVTGSTSGLAIPQGECGSADSQVRRRR
jgi:CBS-domain-containing membrane protein